MRNQIGLAVRLSVLLSLGSPWLASGQAVPSQPTGPAAGPAARPGRGGHDGARRAGGPAGAAAHGARPFRRLRYQEARPVSPALKGQPKEGRITGFDFARDPLNADKPFTTFEEVKSKESADRPAVMAAQRKLLESRYDLTPKLDPAAKMSRGKPLCVGPTARLARGHDLREAGRACRRRRSRSVGSSPIRRCPIPLHANGGQVFPQVQTAMFPRLERFDVEFDIPNEFLPEFPPAIFLQNRPELGDVSRGQVVTLSNFRALFKEILTPVQLEGMRLLLTPLPQEEFNLTDDRKSPEPQLGVACLDCHVNGHTTGQFHLSPDIRPQDRRFRLDTVSLRGMFNQQIHGSKRSLRSVEDFTEFEQRTAYFNGDPIRPMKKGFQELPRSVIPHMAQTQNMLDFPPAPKLTLTGRLNPSEGDRAESCGARLCSSARPTAPCAILRPSTSTTRCTTCTSNGSPRASPATARSRASPCGGSRRARPISTTAAASPWKTRSSSSTWSRS